MLSDIKVGGVEGKVRETYKQTDRQPRGLERLFTPTSLVIYTG